MTSINHTETKLLKLYKKHEILSVEIIVLLSRTFDSIHEDNEVAIEEYSKIEKRLVLKLNELYRVIRSYETDGQSDTDELIIARKMVESNHITVQNLNRKNRIALEYSLKKLSARIGTLNRFPVYRSSQSVQTAPQFIDVRI